MRPNYAVWIGLCIIAVLVTLATKYFAYLPRGRGGRKVGAIPGPPLT